MTDMSTNAETNRHVIRECIEERKAFTIYCCKTTSAGYRDKKIAAGYKPVAESDWMALVFEGIPSAQLTGYRLKTVEYPDGKVSLQLERNEDSSDHIDFIVRADDIVEVDR